MDLQLALRQALEAHQAPMLALAQDLIRIPSENPPGSHYRECTERICRELVQRHGPDWAAAYDP